MANAMDPDRGMRRVRAQEENTRGIRQEYVTELAEIYGDDYSLGLVRGPFKVEDADRTITVIPLGVTYANTPLEQNRYPGLANQGRTKIIRAGVYAVDQSGAMRPTPHWISFNLLGIPNGPDAQVNPDVITPDKFDIEPCTTAYDPGAFTPISGVASGSWFDTALPIALGGNVAYAMRGVIIVEMRKFTDIAVHNGSTIVQSMGRLGAPKDDDDQSYVYVMDLFVPSATLQVRARSLDGSVVPTDYIRLQALLFEQVRMTFNDTKGNWSVEPIDNSQITRGSNAAPLAFIDAKNRGYQP